MLDLFCPLVERCGVVGVSTPHGGYNVPVAAVGTISVACDPGENCFCCCYLWTIISINSTPSFKDFLSGTREQRVLIFASLHLSWYRLNCSFCNANNVIENPFTIIYSTELWLQLCHLVYQSHKPLGQAL